MKDLTSIISVDLLLQFEAISRLKSLKLAALELGLSPSAVTQALKQLESRLGTTLCIRGKDKFSLTETGEIVFESAKRIRGEVSNLSTTLRADPESYTGLFSIGILDNFSNETYKNVISEIVKTFPNIQLAIQAIDPDEMLEWLKSGDLDLGFGIFYEKDSSLSYVEIGKQRLYYYASKKHPLFKKKKVDVADLYNQNLMWFGSNLRRRSELKNDIFSRNSRYKMELKAYSNCDSGALDILDSGFAITPFAEGHSSKTRKNLDIKVRTPDLTSYMIYNPALSNNQVLKCILTFSGQ